MDPPSPTSPKASATGQPESPSTPASPGSPVCSRSPTIPGTPFSTRFAEEVSSDISPCRLRNRMFSSTAVSLNEDHTTEEEAGKPMFERPFVSTRVRKEEAPDMTEWDKETKSNNRIIEALPWAGIVLGSALCGFLAWYGWQSVPTNTYNLVLDESFANGIQNSTWNYEIQLGGFGNGEFDMTTNSAQNAYVDDNNLLHIVPTLSSDTYGADAITNGYTLNLTTAGICTSDQTDKCAITSNSSTGTILPPIRSARLTTKGKHGIEYGKVEVVAKIPKGDWMWPAIWMMPTNDTYGPWPASGEMDIMEARGNTPGVGVEGRDYVSSTLQWGPSSAYNRYWKTSSVVRMQHGDYSDRFHTFGLEWTPEYVFAYVDSRLRQGMSVRFSKSFYERGQFPRSDWQNNTVILDPWTGTDALPDASNATPFDQEFYLILNVAVGGTNGYFPDTMKGKPWVDATATARRDFWSARDEWYKTWPAEEERGMIVKSVKMYQLVEAGKRYI